MSADAGIPSNNSLNLKFAIALFSMVQFRVVPGGSEQIHEIQQSFNARYALNHSAFDLIPTDGYYSREVNVGLIFALQFELGYSDDTATGAVGPGTKVGIDSNAQFGVGETDGSKYYVHIFKAAMIFNEYSVVYNGSFSADDSSRTRQFQDFYQINQSSRADYQTWLALLISTGDPERQAAACDTASRITPDRAAVLKSPDINCKVVGRYLSNPYTSLPEKAMTRPEAESIIQNGLEIIPIMQEDNSKVEYFDYDYGFGQGRTASEKATELGLPYGSMVYFAVDADAMEYQVYDEIADYFHGVNDAVHAQGSKITIGIYSARNTCSIIIQEGLASSCYVSDMSTGYSGNLGFPLPSSWAFDQISEVDTGSGFSIDRVVLRNGAPTVKKLDVTPTQPEENVWTYLQRLQEIAESMKSDRQEANLMVATYIRNIGYSNGYLLPVEWNFLFGEPNTTFGINVGLLNIQEFSSYYDPVLGRTVDIYHLMASINGYLYKKVHDPTSPPTNPELADLAGWAGDAVSFECDYWKSDEGLSATAFTKKYFNVGKRFDDEDLAQDFDAINIAFATYRQNLRLSDAIIIYYTGLTRAKRFNNAISNRFVKMSNVETAFFAATAGSNVVRADVSGVQPPETQNGNDPEYNTYRLALETHECAGRLLPEDADDALHSIAAAQAEIIDNLRY
jgi:peptidoglycan hydrolase-like protein with peptidoglycan-binding domain